MKKAKSISDKKQQININLSYLEVCLTIIIIQLFSIMFMMVIG